MFLRRFGTTAATCGRVRSKLNTAVKQNRVEVDEDVAESRHEREIRRKNARPVVNAAAQTLLEKLLGRSFADEKVGPQTPLSSEELGKVFGPSQRNIRLKYRVLGTSQRQLMDSTIVEKDVLKLLERDEVEKATLLCFMAGHKGAFGIARVTKYLVDHGRMNAALKLYEDTKKRGIVPTGGHLNYLFGGFSEFRDWDTPSGRIGRNQLLKLLSIYEREKSHMRNAWCANTLLLGVANCDARDCADLASKIWADLKKDKKLKPDIRTYTLMLRIMREQLNSQYLEAIKTTEEVFSHMQRRRDLRPDAYLLWSYVRVFWETADAKLKARAIRIIKDWYRVCPTDKIGEPIDETQIKIHLKGPRRLEKESDYEVLIPEHEINMNHLKRFEPVEEVIQAYKNGCEMFSIEYTYDPKKRAGKNLRHNY